MADEPVEETTTRDEIEAAFDKHAAEAAPEVAAPEPAPVEAEAPATSQGEASPPASTASNQVTPPSHDNTPPVTVQAPVTKPPRSWSAEAKAAFATLPEPVKQDVLRREKEISQGLERVAPMRQHYEKFSEVTKPFEPLFQAYNVDPIDAAKTLFATRAALEIGTPEQKAQVVANIIHDFGLDVKLLDDLLVKKGPVQPFRAAAPPPAPVRDPEVQMLIDTIKQAQTEKAEAEIAKVSALPHFEELREDIADVVEAFHKTGRTISLESAYKRALAMNPDLEPATTATPEITKSQAAAILASRNAASSVSGAPRTGPKQVPEDRRSQIAAAFESARR